jgi:pimeloyl-ACP methyl ester carboxylesterase
VNVTLHRVDAGFNQVAVLEYEARRRRDVTLVVAHGYSSSKQNLDGLCAFLASHGYGVYSLDFPGHKLGASGGRLRDVDDLFAAMDGVVRFARERGAATVYVLGHSMGAATALCIAARDPSLAGAIAIATGPGRPTALEGLAARGVVDLRSSYVDGPALPEIARAWEPRLGAALPQLAGRPVLVIAADRDAIVSRASVQELHERVPGSTFVTVESDHTFAGDNSRGAVLQWLNAMHPRRSAEAVETPLVDAPL